MTPVPEGTQRVIYYEKRFDPPLDSCPNRDERLALLQSLFRKGIIKHYSPNCPLDNDQVQWEADASGKVTAIKLHVDIYGALEHYVVQENLLLGNQTGSQWQLHSINGHSSPINNIVRINSSAQQAHYLYARTFLEPLYEHTEHGFVRTRFGETIVKTLTQKGLAEGVDFSVSIDNPCMMTVGYNAYNRIVKKFVGLDSSGPGF